MLGARQLDQWEEPDTRSVHAALDPAGRPWWIAGGMALSLFLDRPIRPHHDLDVVILERDAAAFREALASWDVRTGIGWEGAPRASRRVMRPWPAGDPLPRDKSAFWCRPTTDDRWRFELLVNPASDERWVFKRDPTLTRPLSEIGATRNGTPYLLPEIALLHKATSSPITEQDAADFAAVAPAMTRSQQSWLAGAIARSHSTHTWLDGASLRLPCSPP